MQELKEQPESKVTVEDLLKFKRQETPGHDFWDSFDCSMQKKTIKALVSEKPKHRRWAPYIVKWSMGVVPVTGAAVFSLSMFLNKAPISGLAENNMDAGDMVVAAQIDAPSDVVAAPLVQDGAPGQAIEFSTLANNSSFIMDVLNPFDGQKRYKTVQAVKNISIEQTSHTRYSGDTIKPSGFTAMLASAPSFDHF
jgi:hypothetical protein